MAFAEAHGTTTGMDGWVPLRLPDFLRTSTFRLATTFAITFAVSAVLLFAFIYWQTALYETDRIDNFIARDAGIVAGESEPEIYRAVSSRILGDLHRITFAGLFDGSGRLMAGNLLTPPKDLPEDGRAHGVEAVHIVDGVDSIESSRAVALRLANGNLLIIGRNVDELRTLREIVLRALELGVIPAMALALIAGAFVSRRAQRRVKAVHRSAERIMYGDLRERLPVRGTKDDFDRLAQSVNLMLDEIGRLLDSVKAAGDDIAHDLRTPLARLRTRLERSKETAETPEEFQAVVGSAIVDLDQALAVITTLLRIGEIDSGRRRAAFADLDLGALVDEAAQIYSPLAEEKQIAFHTEIEAGLTVNADRGLLLEAFANILHNAIKFMQPGGAVTIAAFPSPEGPRVRIADNGPGIPAEDRERVFDRFYRLDKSRHIEGSGLGLSLVASIMKLHGFELILSDAAPGAAFEIVCRNQARS